LLLGAVKSLLTAPGLVACAIIYPSFNLILFFNVYLEALSTRANWLPQLLTSRKKLKGRPGFSLLQTVLMIVPSTA
jgi:hypothetical protein